MVVAALVVVAQVVRQGMQPQEQLTLVVAVAVPVNQIILVLVVQA
jgi:hypothetical protein